MQAKYIILESFDGLEYPFVFSPLINHKDFAKTYDFLGKVVGAGFVSFGDEGFNCFGESISLKISSRVGVDEEVFKRCYKRI